MLDNIFCGWKWPTHRWQNLKLEVSQNYINDLYYTMHVLKCEMVSCNNALYKLTFWRRRKTAPRYLSPNDLMLHIWWVCGDPRRPENKGDAGGGFMPMLMREFYFVLWKKSNGMEFKSTNGHKDGACIEWEKEFGCVCMHCDAAVLQWNFKEFIHLTVSFATFFFSGYPVDTFLFNFSIFFDPPSSWTCLISVTWK